MTPNVSNPTPLDQINEVQIPSTTPLSFLSLLNHIRCQALLHLSRQTSGDEFIRNQTNEDTDRQRNEADDDGDGPLRTIQTDYTERFTANENNHDLSTYHYCVYYYEEDISMDSFEYVEFVVKTAIAVFPQLVSKILLEWKCIWYVLELIEDLHPDEGIED